MTNDFTPYTAGLITDWLSQDSQMPTPPSTLYVGVVDSTGTEVSGSFSNDRVAVDTPTEWTRTNTAFENTNQVDFGEASGDVTDIERVAFFDDTLANGGNKLVEYVLDSTPFDVSDGTTLLFNAGELDFDVLD